MTTPSLFDIPPASVPEPVSTTPKKTRTEMVADYFRAHPGKWIDGMVLESFAGRYAWRSRVSDCRKKFGMAIENRVRREIGHAHNCPAIGAWDIPEACHCGRHCVFIVSEYRYMPDQEVR